MVTKWVIAVFFSVSALLARDVRAVEQAELKAAAKAASRALKAKVKHDPSDYYAKKYAETMLSAYMQLGRAEAATALKAFSKSCRTGKIRIIEVRGNNSVFARQLNLKHDTSDIVAFLTESAKKCDDAFALLERVDAKVAPKKITVESTDLFSGRVKLNDIEKWASELLGGKFLSVLNEFELDCRHKIDRISFQSYTSYEQQVVGSGKKQRRLGVLRLGADDKIEAVSTALSDASASCRQVFAPLIAFNRVQALSHGLFFKFDVNDFIRKRITADHMLAWINYFSDNSNQLGFYRDDILTQSTSRLFETKRECFGRKRNSPNKYCRYLIQVEFANYSEVSKPGLLSALFTTFLFIKDIAFSPVYVFGGLAADADITGAIGRQYREVLQSRVYFNVNQEPPVPNAMF